MYFLLFGVKRIDDSRTCTKIIFLHYVTGLACLTLLEGELNLFCSLLNCLHAIVLIQTSLLVLVALRIGMASSSRPTTAIDVFLVGASFSVYRVASLKD